MYLFVAESPDYGDRCYASALSTALDNHYQNAWNAYVFLFTVTYSFLARGQRLKGFVPLS